MQNSHCLLGLVLFILSERKGDWGGPFGHLPRIRWDPGNFGGCNVLCRLKRKEKELKSIRYSMELVYPGLNWRRGRGSWRECWNQLQKTFQRLETFTLFCPIVFIFSYYSSRPEYVAECFIKLVETGHNGDVMIVSLINTISKKVFL